MSRRNEKPTGRTRHRAETWKSVFDSRTVLILQLEVEFDDGPSDANGLPAYLAGRLWRDARVEDLTVRDTSADLLNFGEHG